MTFKKDYDVVILGGGLAGLTLSIQLKRNMPEINILVLERRKGEAPAAAHKVGESTVELGTHYLREVLDLKSYLDAKQLPKYGLRFYLTPQHKEDLTLRVEIGPRNKLPVPSHQIDRGIFENELTRRADEMGIQVMDESRVREVEISNEIHSVQFEKGNDEYRVNSKWVVDATGRAEFLKRKLGFQKPMDHDINAAWFRFNSVIDVDDWSDDETWSDQLNKGLRKLGTIHFMDKGYWVWIIPLTDDSTSVGIVADPHLHPFDEFNTFEKAKTWLEKNEPQCARMFSEKENDLLDFKILKHYSHDTQKYYSADRWGVTGEAGSFLDPFYSPGTDFISLANSWLNDLIIRDLTGEDIGVRSIVYERVHAALIENWLPIYKDKYPLMGHTQIMVCKIFWDFATYWGIQVPLFVNNAFTDLDVLLKLSAGEGIFQKLGKMNSNVQKMFMDWAPDENETFTRRYFDPLEIDFLKKFQEGISMKFENSESLLSYLEENMMILEKVASEYFRRVNALLNKTALDETVDPYSMDLKNPVSIGSSGIDRDPAVKKEVDKYWMYTTTKERVV